MRNKVLDPRLRGDDQLFSASLENRGFSLASQGGSEH